MKKNTKNTEISYKVIRKLGAISESEYDRKNWTTKEVEHVKETKELREVAWNDGTPKLEIRTWYNTNGQETCGKGITLSDEELSCLRFLLESLDTEETA